MYVTWVVLLVNIKERPNRSHCNCVCMLSCFSQAPRLVFNYARLHTFFVKMLRNKAGTRNMHEDEEKGDWQGNISFEKIVAKPAFATMTVPAQFVHQHANKVQKLVILQSEADGKQWTVEANVYFPHDRPQVVLSRGLKEFSIFNALVKGDRLTFTLVAMSKFKVSIARSSENSKAWPPLRTMKTGLKKDSQGQPKKYLRPQYFIDLTDEPELSLDECNGLFVRDGEAREAETIAHSIPNANAAISTLSSSSNMDSRLFEPEQVAAPLPSSQL